MNSNMQVKGKHEDRLELANRCHNLVESAKYKEVVTNIEISKKKLSDYLKNLEEMALPIQQKKILGLIKTTDVKATIETLYERFMDMTSCTCNAINSCNNNAQGILELISILAKTECDLYDILDKNELSKVEITNLIKDLCDTNNIKDEAVEQILTQSINRSFTLRDRIRSLRDELNQKINEIECAIKSLETVINNKDKDLQSFIELQKEGFYSDLNSFTLQQKKEITEIIINYKKEVEELQIAANNVLKSIRDAESMYKEKIDSLELKLKQMILNEFEIQNKKISLHEENCKFLSEKCDSLSSTINLLNGEIEILKKKNFFDSVYFKIGISIVSLSTLISTIYLYLSI